jgi:RHS repeat-associated protein
VGTSGTHHYLTDGLGSTMALTDGAGNIVNTYENDAYGEVRSSTGSQDNVFTFTGEQIDDSTGLEYLRTRYYDSETGSFISRDLLATPNRFSYVAGDPVNLIDPWGLCVSREFIAKWEAKIARLGQGKLHQKWRKAWSETLEVARKMTCIGEDIHEGLKDLGYFDFNVTGCGPELGGAFGHCVSFGFQVSFGEGFHPYFGCGVGTTQFGVTGNFAPGQNITTGMNCGIQGSIGSPGFGPSVGGQVGGAGRDSGRKWPGSAFGEAGVGLGLSGTGVNAAATCVNVF